MTLQFSAMAREDRRNLQMALNEKTPARLTVDGDFGAKSIATLKSFQGKSNIPQSGLYDEATKGLLSAHINFKYLLERDYIAASVELSCEVASIKAFVEVEAAGDGFLADGRCDILFERHKFYSAISKLKGASEAVKVMGLYPNICNRESGGYKGDEAEYSRLSIAESINVECARASASWGMFQIMGFNYKAAGYTSATEFSEAMKKSEPNQLGAFVKFIKADQRLLVAIRNKQWTTLASIYNGPEYFKHKYDVRMANSYAIFAG